MELELGGEGISSLLALTHALHPQGRAGADGARGMPGEPGVKVTSFPPVMPVSALRAPPGLTGFSWDTIPHHSGQSRKR